MTVFNAKWVILKKKGNLPKCCIQWQIILTVFNAKWVILKKRKFA